MHSNYVLQTKEVWVCMGNFNCIRTKDRKVEVEELMKPIGSFHVMIFEETNSLYQDKKATTMLAWLQANSKGKVG